ncbi:MAG TPA: hypothetical protein VGB17_13275 [Pyrinomonadaceae bacterium]
MPKTDGKPRLKVSKSAGPAVSTNGDRPARSRTSNHRRPLEETRKTSLYPNIQIVQRAFLKEEITRPSCAPGKPFPALESS